MYNNDIHREAHTSAHTHLIDTVECLCDWSSMFTDCDMCKQIQSETTEPKAHVKALNTITKPNSS